MYRLLAQLQADCFGDKWCGLVICPNSIDSLNTMASSKYTRELLNGQFTLINDETVRCKLCQADFKYHRSTSSLTYHLRSKHAFVSTSSSSSSSATPPLQVSVTRQPTLLDVSEKTRPLGNAKCSSVTDAIARWIAMNCRPINICTDDGLQEVIRIASSDPTYTLPSRPVIDKKIDELFNAEQIKVQTLLDRADHVALTADYWSSHGNESYLGITAHVVDESWKLHSLAIAVRQVEDRHFATACAEHFSTEAMSWKIYDRVTTFGTENARNVTAAVQQLPYEHMPCIAHSLQLSVKAALDESGVEKTLDKCRKIVGHFKHSPANSVELHAKQSEIGMNQESLVQDVPTRWNSTWRWWNVC